MKNLKTPLGLFAISYLIYGIVMNIRMFTEQMWPTYLFFISIFIAILFLFLNKPTKQLKNYKFWQIIIGLIPVTFFFIYMQIVNSNSEYDSNIKWSTKENITYFRNGIWIDEKDTLAGIEIKNRKWIMFYKGMETDSSDVYDYKLTNKSPEYAENQSKPRAFLILTNKLDTLKYEILGYDKGFLSLMYFPRGNILTYKKKNVW
jgi:hypothetical protein